jgi:hypothetical protein
MVKNTSGKYLNNLQYFLSSIMAFSFGIGLFPFMYQKILPVIAVCLTIQVIVSVFRGRLLNVFLEIFLVGLAVISLTPVLGIITRFIGVLFCILEMAAFKNGVLYSQMDARAFNSKSGSKSKNSSRKKSAEIKKPDVKFADADFEEK